MDSKSEKTYFCPKKTSAACNLVVITSAIPLLLLPEHSLLAVSEIVDQSDTCAVPSVCNAAGMLIFIKHLPRLHKGVSVTILSCVSAPIRIPVMCKARETHGENRTFVGDEVCGQARVRPIDKLDEACTNADD